MTTALVFQNMAKEVLRRLRDFPPDEAQGAERTEAILAASLREAFEAGKGPSSEGLNKHRLDTLREILRQAREKAEGNLAAEAGTGSERAGFERGLVEGYKFAELTLAKLERGDFL